MRRNDIDDAMPDLCGSRCFNCTLLIRRGQIYVGLIAALTGSVLVGIFVENRLLALLASSATVVAR